MALLPLRAGDLDRRITIQREQIGHNDLGEPISTWVELATVSARKREARGDERFAEQQRVGRTLKTFAIRWSSAVKSVNSKDRVLFDGRQHDITDVREIGRREGIEIDCYARSEEAMAP